MKSNILVLIVLLSSTFLAIATELNLYLYTGVSSSLNLVCNDGSPAGYYYRPASNWLIIGGKKKIIIIILMNSNI